MQALSISNGVKGYSLVIRAGQHVQSFALLLIRLAWGWQLLESGFAHLGNVAGTAKNFADWGIPFPTANVYLAGGTEMIGGALLILGFASRAISIPLFFNFVVAYLTASREAVLHAFTQNPDLLINDAAFPFLVMSLLILAFGPGKFSLDAIAGRFFHIPSLANSPLFLTISPTSTARRSAVINHDPSVCFRELNAQTARRQSK